MTYDKYRNWKPGTPHEADTLKWQVLKDIHEAEDEKAKLEILDSFEDYVERAHNIEIAEHLSAQILLAVRSLLVGAILSKLPTPTPIARPSRAPVSTGWKNE